MTAFDVGCDEFYEAYYYYREDLIRSQRLFGQVFVIYKVGEFSTGRYGGSNNEISPTFRGRLRKNKKNHRVCYRYVIPAIIRKTLFSSCISEKFCLPPNMYPS
jgi:hypothetical protein